MTAEPVERLYALIRIRAGDYLLPGNDRVTLYRVTSYVEDGSGWVTDRNGRERQITGTWWAAWRYRGTAESAADDVDLLDWNDDDGNERWLCVVWGARTRRAAIADALRH